MENFQILSDAKKIIDKLDKLGGSAGNKMLLSKLRISKKRYFLAKKFLIDEKMITNGKGKGGSVILNEIHYKKYKNAGWDSFSDPSVDNKEDDSRVFLNNYFSENDWQSAAIEIFYKIFDEKELISFLDEDMKNYFISEKKRRTSNSHLNKRELATILISVNDQDLLRCKRIRDSLSLKFGINTLSKFIPGSESLKNFIISCRLPLSLLGKRTEDDRQSMIYIPANSDLGALEDFQEDIKNQVLYEFHDHVNISNLLVTLPTGSGKTRTAIETVYEYVDYHLKMGSIENCNLIVWVAQSEELCEQAIDSFKNVWENHRRAKGLTILRLWSDFWRKGESNFDEIINTSREPVVMVASVNMLRSIIVEENCCKTSISIKEHIDLMIIDEAHHSGASSYKNIIFNIRQFQKEKNTFSKLQLIGLTATPVRKDDFGYSTRDLINIFDKIITPSNTIEKFLNHSGHEGLMKLLVERGVLARQVFEETIKTGLTLDFSTKDVQQNLEDFQLNAIDNNKGKQKRRELICDRIEAILQEDSEALIMYFGVSIKDSDMISAILQTRGIKSKSISGNTSKSTRLQVIDDFKMNRIKVLCNCRLLTTGFDAPKVTHLVLGWKTTSPILYNQIIGRGLRGPKFGGTEKCHVIQVEDNYKNIDDSEFALSDYIDNWKKAA